MRCDTTTAYLASISRETGGGGYIDSRGFFRSLTQAKLGEIQMGKLANILDYPNNEKCKSCWICGRWSEVKFSIDLSQNNGDEEQDEGVYLCLR